MKIKNILLAVLLILAVFFTGCSKKSDKAPSADNNVASDTAEAVADSDIDSEKGFAEKYINTGLRPIAVMVDNDDENARPQAGLEDAYLIYEMPVEGGATRFMALFQNVETMKIGPVRSSRHYFLDYAMENDAVYTHFGWSPRAMQDISAYSVDKINGILDEDNKVFWREEKFSGDWHSAFTSVGLIKDHIVEKEFESETDPEHEIGLKFTDEEYTADNQTPASTIMLNYSSRYNTSYSYNTQTGLYEKNIGSAPHIMQSGKVLAFENIIIELIADTALGDGSDRRDIKTTGSGSGYYISNGFCEPITWTKEIRETATNYFRADGSELLINPGNTIVNIISPQIGVVVE